MPGIVPIPSGDFTPGALAAVQNPAYIINATWDLALSKSTNMETAIADATSGFLDLLITPTVTPGTATTATVVEPTITIADASTTSVYADFETQYLELVALLTTKFADFQAEYFPDDSAFYAQVEDWLQAALSDPSGLPAATRAQLLGDAQAAILTESNRAKDAVLATFATRRMPMPGGQAASAVLQIEQTAQDKMAEAGRNITKLSIDQLRFDIEKAIDCRKTALSSAVEYIKALASGPDVASRLVNVGYDAQSKMVSSAASWLNARADVAKAANQVSQFNVSTALDAASKNQAAELHSTDNHLKALLAKVQAIANQCNALLNNVHASSGTSYTVSGT